MKLKLKTVPTKLFILRNDGPILHVGPVFCREEASNLKRGGFGDGDERNK